jgi:hypothetical protein
VPYRSRRGLDLAESGAPANLRSLAAVREEEGDEAEAAAAEGAGGACAG